MKVSSASLEGRFFEAVVFEGAGAKCPEAG